MKNLIIVLVFALPVVLTAQQHPLPVESALLLESGKAQFDVGIAHFRTQSFPLSGLTGNLTKLGSLRFAIALSRYVEIQTDGTMLNILKVTKRDSAFNSTHTTLRNPTTDVGDFSVWTKIGVLNEYSSGISLSIRFGVQLPNASNESGLGIDEMNFFSSLLVEKYAAGKWTLNIGLGILGDPTQVSSQHDVGTYAFEYVVPLTDATFFLVQTAGRIGHNGIGVQRLANGKLGIEQSFGDVALKLLSVANFSPADNAKGVELSLSYLFHAVTL